MNWSQALSAMEKGLRVRHEYFTKEEYFELRDGRLTAEDGCSMRGWFRNEEWQKTGWSLHHEQFID